MTPTRQGSFRLFHFAGVDVYLHWLWFLAPVYFIGTTASKSSFLWPVLECLALFAIVLLHEFGHALACRQVGGQANQIVLWPLGGVAYVNPPPRPGPILWSIAAGPLVNVALAPVLTILVFAGGFATNLGETMPNVYEFLKVVCLINYWLLFFNMLPIYPLDGGQILQSLLWFVLGRARSLLVATVIGFAGVAGLIVFALIAHDRWLGIMCVFIVLMCWRGLMQARVLAQIAKLPHRAGFACPSCRQPPLIGPYWRCDQCHNGFDTFETQGTCPHCGAQFPVTRCPECGRSHPMAEWAAAL